MLFFGAREFFCFAFPGGTPVPGGNTTGYTKNLFDFFPIMKTSINYKRENADV